MNPKYLGITNDGLNRLYMLLITQTDSQVALFQKATLSLSNFELSYANDSKIIISPESYKDTKKLLKQSIKLVRKQLRFLEKEQRELVTYLKGRS